MSVKNLKEFKKTGSLQGVVTKLLENIQPELNDLLLENSNRKKFIIGYHLRHVFDSTSPTVLTYSSSSNGKSITPEPEKVRNIKAMNNQLGLHTINHAIDSLFYPFNKLMQNNNIIILKFNFRNIRAFGGFERVYSNSFEASKYAHDSPKPKFPNDQLINRIAEKSLSYKIDIAEYDIDSKFIEEYDLINSSNSLVQKKIKNVYSNYIYGIHNICELLGIEHSSAHHKSIAASLYQMMSYFKDFGENVITIIIRPKGDFNYVSGLSIFTHHPITLNKLEGIFLKLFDHNLILNNKNKFSTKNRPTDYAKQIDGLFSVNDFYKEIKNNKLFPRIEVNGSEYLNARLIDLLITDDNFPDLFLDQDLIIKNIENLKKSVSSFLNIAIHFLHQRSEGRKLKYGLLLGNPYLMKYWNGPNPFPCAKSDRDSGDIEDDPFFSLNQLPDQVHLVENPAERALVFPYKNILIQDEKESLPSFLLELGDFHEAFMTMNDYSLWSPEHKPYIFLTERFSWAFASVVGPDSEIRFFFKGEMKAYRDGKGWKIFNDSELGNLQLFNNLINGHKLKEALMKIAIQLSPFVRNEARGGYLIYVPTDNTDWVTEGKNRKVQPLYDAEPRRFEYSPYSSNMWLTGRKLLDENGNIDMNVLPLVIQASSLDGATIIGGNQGEIKFIGSRLEFEFGNSSSHNSMNERIGSKRRAASNFVKWANTKKDLKNAFAITISSDGPISFFTFANRRVQKYELFKKIEEYD